MVLSTLDSGKGMGAETMLKDLQEGLHTAWGLHEEGWVRMGGKWVSPVDPALSLEGEMRLRTGKGRAGLCHGGDCSAFRHQTSAHLLRSVVWVTEWGCSPPEALLHPDVSKSPGLPPRGPSFSAIPLQKSLAFSQTHSLGGRTSTH